MAQVSSSLWTPLVPNEGRNDGIDAETSRQGFGSVDDVIEEAKKQLWLAGPLIASVGHFALKLAKAAKAQHWPSAFRIGFIKLAIPSAIMICFEYWTFVMVVLLSGLLPNPKLETSVLSISLNTCWTVYMVSVGLGSAISTRVSNELGAGRPQSARLALQVMIIMALSEGAAIAIATVSVRHVWGKLYSNENEVITYVAKMMPLLALSDFLDGFQCVLSGAARGCGCQNLCVYINLGAYYVVGIPTAVLFAFILHIGGMGLWMGIICALLVQVTALVAVNACADWSQEALKAANRVQDTSLVTDKAVA
ncbi:hypothetical protein ACLB2K_036786 [Fragaria x ananassa]